MILFYYDFPEIPFEEDRHILGKYKVITRNAFIMARAFEFPGGRINFVDLKKGNTNVEEVYGYLYEVPDECESEIDAMVGFPEFLQKTKAIVFCDDTRCEIATVYHVSDFSEDVLERLRRIHRNTRELICN